MFSGELLNYCVVFIKLYVLINCGDGAQSGIIFQKVVAAFAFSLKRLKNRNMKLFLFYSHFATFSISLFVVLSDSE